MYLEVKNMKKSYGKDGSYIQVLKGISTGVDQGQMLFSISALVAAASSCTLKIIYA